MVLYPFHNRQGCLCTNSINLGTQPFLEYVIVKKMSLNLILETEFELSKDTRSSMRTCAFPVNPTCVAMNGHCANGINGRGPKKLGVLLRKLHFSVSLNQMQSEMDILCCLLKRAV